MAGKFALDGYWIKQSILAFVIIASIGWTVMHLPVHTRRHEFRQFNSHWQKTQNIKMLFCFQRMETMLDVKKCMIKLGVYI